MKAITRPLAATTTVVSFLSSYRTRPAIARRRDPPCSPRINGATNRPTVAQAPYPRGFSPSSVPMAITFTARFLEVELRTDLNDPDCETAGETVVDFAEGGRVVAGE